MSAFNVPSRRTDARVTFTMPLPGRMAFLNIPAHMEPSDFDFIQEYLDVMKRSVSRPCVRDDADTLLREAEETE